MTTFADLNLSAPLMQALTDLNYESPTGIQSQALPILLGEPTDFIGLAATGTGKTAAFSIPLLERIDVSKRVTQALVLCPTRELALQVAGQINLLGKHLHIKALPIYGGAGYHEQLHGLKAGAHVVVGTPGRLIDHLERKTLKLDNLKTLVLDEADEMISMGFKDELEEILKASPRETSNIWLFSATMEPQVRRIADTYLKKPKHVQINKKEMLSTTVEQIYYLTREALKQDVLCKLIDAADDFYGIIFCQTKALVMDLTEALRNKGYKVDCLHGDKNQNAREYTMQAFRNKRVNILVCTDVASRGIDVKDVTHVINYSIPRELDNYVHRIGRTARSGKSGYAMSLVTPSNRGLIPRIEKMTNSRMTEGKIPSGKEIAQKKLGYILAPFKEQKAHGRVMELLSDEWKQGLADMSKEEIVGRFLAMKFPDLFKEQATREERSHKKEDHHKEGNRSDDHSHSKHKKHNKKFKQRHYFGASGKKKHKK
ncbi:DEAD/DEAH box helicase [bacterium]|nr:DEAD/DEAH box helicase [bacterium]